MRIRFNLKGNGEFEQKLRSAKRYMDNLSPLYRAWGIETLKWIKLNYRTGGAKAGGWKPLRPLTVRSRRQGSNKPLLDTGHMMRQWNWQLRPWGVEIGNPMDIAKYHEEGTKGPYTIKPVRKRFLWFGVTIAERRKGQAGRLKGKSLGIFAKKVEHPGLPARRQLPNEKEIMPTLKRVAEVFLRRAIK